jgi:hypothetical protein
MRRPFILALLLVPFLSTLAFAQTSLVLPNGNTAVEGNTQTVIPLSSNPWTFQWVFPASQLASVPLGSQITGIAFRLDTSAAAQPNISFSQWNLQVSTSPNGPGTLSGTFAANIGADVVTVNSGPLSVNTSIYPFGGNPNGFGPFIPFSTFYTYNGGNLLFTLNATGNGSAQIPLDANSVDANGSTVGNPAFGSASGNPNFFNYPITEISFTTGVPEPTTWALLSLTGVVGGGTYWWKRRRHAVRT